MSCCVCKHNQVKDLDRALLTGVSLHSLSKTYGFSTTALHHHREHLVKKMTHARQHFHDNVRLGLYCKLTLVMEMVLGVVRGTRAGEDFKLFLQASREFTRIVSLMHKMAVPLEPEFIYCLMATPQWDLQEESLLPNAFQALAKTRQSLKVNLYAPCPDPDTNPVPVAEPSSPPGPWEGELETLTAAQVPEPLPRVCPMPARQQTQAPKTGQSTPANIRDFSAKLARN
jgi:hypothetical protein